MEACRGRIDKGRQGPYRKGTMSQRIVGRRREAEWLMN